MSATEPPVDATLLRWDQVERSHTTTGLLLGNGASRAVWDAFAYGSLYDQARNLIDGKALTADDITVFNAYATSNFEAVLQALSTTNKVLNALGKSDPAIMARYNHVRQALVQAVHNSHIPHEKVPATTLQCIAGELNRYEFVYSTNYDLLVYWSVMHVGADGFKDFFWGGGYCFDLADSDVFGKPTKLLFIHGGLQIYLDDDRNTCKLTADADGTILEKFAQGSTIPVFVSEGDSDDKLSAIYRSDYLSFAYSCLLQHEGPLVVFGQGLGTLDQHIVDAINKARVQTLAIGICPLNENDIKSAKVHYRQCFPNSELHFFDSTTHPMGDPSLRVNP